MPGYRLWFTIWSVLVFPFSFSLFYFTLNFSGSRCSVNTDINKQKSRFCRCWLILSLVSQIFCKECSFHSDSHVMFRFLRCASVTMTWNRADNFRYISKMLNEQTNHDLRFFRCQSNCVRLVKKSQNENKNNNSEAGERENWKTSKI